MSSVELDSIISWLRSKVAKKKPSAADHPERISKHLTRLMALRENPDNVDLGPIIAAFDLSSKKIPPLDLYDYLEDGSTKHSSASSAPSLMSVEISPQLLQDLRDAQAHIDLSIYPKSLQNELRSNETMLRVAQRIQAGFNALEIAAKQLPGPEIRDLWTKVPYKQPEPLPPGQNLPEGFPSQPLANRCDPIHLKHVTLDTLMFIFYFRTDPRSQYMAARELKKRHWRFHTKHQTWFHRHTQPTLCTDTLEQGDFVYFDHESDWCTRIKNDFVFEYAYLEDEVPLE